MVRLHFEDVFLLGGNLLVYGLRSLVGELLDRVLCILRLRSFFIPPEATRTSKASKAIEEGGVLFNVYACLGLGDASSPPDDEK